MGTEEINKDISVANWFSQLTFEQWVAIPVSGAKPSARYKVIFVVKLILMKKEVLVSSVLYFFKAIGIVYFLDFLAE